jgi:DNA-directed RNA polymerase specialized sigma24 family protein
MPEQSDENTKLLRALLALAVDEREERVKEMPGAQKTEVILDSAGLASGEIAALTGKQAGSVRMALSRARKGNDKDDRSSDG